jgi:hypothetical protein
MESTEAASLGWTENEQIVVDNGQVSVRFDSKKIRLQQSECDFR